MNVQTLDRDVKLPSPFSEALIDRHTAAAFLNYSVAGLANLMKREDGPPYLRIGRLIRFQPSALKAWALSQVEIVGTSSNNITST
jgi:hypothetical protein